MAVSVCLALAFTPLMADRVDRTADRTKSADRTAATATDWTAGVGVQLYRPNNGLREGGDFGAQGRAAGLISQAAQSEGSAAISLLLQAVSLDLEQNAENEKLLSEAYARLGDLYQGATTKQVHWYSLAMQYTPDPAARAQLERQISTLGGDAFALAVTGAPTTAPSTRDCGVRDVCEDADHVTLDYYEVMTIDNYSCIDHEWVAFDVPGPDGYIVDIYTMSTDIYGDDTDLELYDGCPGNLIDSDDDGGPGFLSLITTPCLAPGTYYVKVGGWLDWAAPDNFDFYMTLVELCELPEPDGYEPDSERWEANPIGHPTAIPLHANGWGRAKKEIQDHNVFPAADPDYVSFVTRKNMWVTMETRGQFPTFFNDFTGTVGYGNPDTFIQLMYGNEPNYGGLCNTPDEGFSIWCMTDADCEGIVYNPLPSFPDCIPLQYFTVGGAPYWFWENPLAYDDLSGEGYSSKLQICLPRGDHQTTSGTASGDWLLKVWPYFANDLFDYQVMVRNEANCEFEVEPNDNFTLETPLTLGVPMSGITDQSNYGPSGADIDLYSFDVGPEGARVLLETTGYDGWECDNAMELYVGPDDYGYYYFTGVANDDCYIWFSCLDVGLPMADDLLGNMYADANYILNVTTWWLNKNFPYTLLSLEMALPTMEAEPNDTCDVANDVDYGSIMGNIHDYYYYGYCDYDSFHLEVTADTYVTFETDGGIDTTIGLYDGAGTFIGCDDDRGYSLGSLLDGCLPPDDYCLRVRTYGYWTTGDYELFITDGGTCAPSIPVYLGEYGLRCTPSPGQTEFETCPN
jgi:hypothetical protein